MFDTEQGASKQARDFRSGGIGGQRFKLCTLRAQGKRDAPGRSSSGRKDVTGQETEILYSKVHGSQLPMIERGLETAAPTLGSDNIMRALSGDVLCRLG